MDRFGGEVTIAAYRHKFDAQGNRIPTEEAQETPGTYLTAGFLFAFNHVANSTRQATLAPVEPDQDLRGEVPLLPEENEDSEGNSVDDNGGVPAPAEVGPDPELAATGS